jgi:hypothetical protein
MLKPLGPRLLGAVPSGSATTAFGADRATIEYPPGDIVGLINAAGLQIGDSLYAGPPVAFPAIPRFAPEVFATDRPLESRRFEQFRRALAQLDEEGVLLVLRELIRSTGARVELYHEAGPRAGVGAVGGMRRQEGGVRAGSGHGEVVVVIVVRAGRRVAVGLRAGVSADVEERVLDADVHVFGPKRGLGRRRDERVVAVAATVIAV